MSPARRRTPASSTTVESIVLAAHTTYAHLVRPLSRPEPHVCAPIDANGNLTADGTKTYVWNALNQLVEVKEGSTTIATFEYDGEGRRSEKVAGGVTHQYIYDAEDIVEERITGSSSDTIRYYHGAGIDEPLARKNSSDVVTYYLADHLGSIAQETNASGAVTLDREYDAWGLPTQGAGTSGFAYTGREWDPEVSLLYARTRFYAPHSGRFISEDTIRLRGDLNMYRYVESNPLKFTDPFGEDTYSMNRRLGGDTASSLWNPVTHTFVFTTNPDGTIQDTYSWGNKANTTGWNKNQPEDRKAAEEAFRDRQVRWEGDEGFDNKVDDAFNRLNKPENQHRNGLVTNNCKTETQKLLSTARGK